MRKINYTLIALIFVILVSSVEVVLKNYENTLLQELKLSEESQLSSRALALKSAVDRNFNLMASLEAYVTSGYLEGKNDREVMDYMESLYNGVQSSAFNLLIVPKGIVKYVYPLQGNESIVNWDLLNDPRANLQEQIQRGLQTKKMTVDGPFKLLQGNNGLVARKPIYQNGNFWGFVSVGLDKDKLLLESGVAGKDNRALQVAIRNPGEPAFYGDDQIFQMKPMYATIEFYGKIWELAALPQSSSIQSVKEQIQLIRCAYILVLLLGHIFYIYIVRQRNQLSRIVQERTQELLEANEDLTAVNEELKAGEHELQQYTRRLQESEQMLSYMAYHDMLTGIYNRAHFQTLLKEQIERHRDRSSTLAVLFFDMDNFKMVNDSHGHHMGDMLLQEVVNRIRQAELSYQTFARFGGDEFAMLLTDCSYEQDIQSLCERLLDLFKVPCTIANRSFFVSISIGIAQYPQSGTTWDMLLKNADIAMYIAKKESGSSYTFFTLQMETSSLTKLEMGNHLRQAMDRNELEIVYQPQVDCMQGKIIGVEALLRWKHTTKGYISPAVFIPLAEEMGLIVPIGEWILRRACSQMKAWHHMLEQPLAISVNLSVRQLHDERFVDKVCHILEETGLEAKYLEMEITENVAMKDEQLDALRHLRHMGIAISVDDFGTHYSSLSYLKRFPVTKIKLDQSFVRGVQSDDKDRAMIKAIISVANSFQLEIIAEGVETEEQASFLVENGCRQIQGYYFFRPMSAEQVMVVLKQSLRPKLVFMEVAAAGEEE
ncbi:bifunctional diguanylate cyclase/phosphodiesterase [Paenibacillus sedimenti]|uniref:EAL domain-containing protein n=1 Tax=Paenibacillus sedimenti TaxID=2770274 RepID=A0A926QM83_9BACL|nr:EAL domain-containing protein [Paenibacillus sedimenti]MBD0383397.1 EAL domain-containing protein [Paenibacillus sedimenti]